MKGLLKVIFFLVIPITAFLLILSGVFNEKIEPGTISVEPKKVTGVKVGEVQSEAYKNEHKVFGTIVSDESSKISSEIIAQVKNIVVKSGDMVTAGQPLIFLDNEKVNASLNQVAANIETAKARIKSIDEMIKQVEATISKAQTDFSLKEKVYERMKNLYEAGAVSLQEKDQAETAYLAAKSQLAEAEAQLEITKAQRAEAVANLEAAEAVYTSAAINVKDATITAPFSGVIVDTHVDTGDLVSPGTPLVTMEKAPYYLEVFVDERKQNQLKIGDQISVAIEAMNATVKGRVAEIIPKVDPASRTFKVKIEIQEQIKGLKSGMFGYAFLSEGIQQGIFIPKSAVYYWSQLSAVYVVDNNGIAHLRYVQLGKEQDNTVEVLSGLNPGEKIVLDHLEKIQNGVQVVTQE